MNKMQRFKFLLSRWIFPKKKKLKEWLYLNKLDWDYLSANRAAISLLEVNLNKINWTWLSLNPAAIHLLEKNPYKIYRIPVCRNSGIFEYE